MDWESKFQTWGQPQSQAEDRERDQTEQELKNALGSKLGNLRYRVYPKGSYRRGTNVRRGSDVDIAVELRGVGNEESFRIQKSFNAKDLTDADLSLKDATPLSMADFKKQVHDALVGAFGANAVSWGNKSIKVREKVTTLPADVVPCRFYKRYDHRHIVHEGIELVPDKGPNLENWPDHDHSNGDAKNANTSYRYKRTVRGLKSLENEMVERGIIKPVSSFLIESLVYNLDDMVFRSPSNFRNCIASIYEIERMLSDEAVQQEMHEVNELKYLFRGMQAWTVDDALRFINSAKGYLGI